ncbi:hypothetical protein [Nocardia neocaledoniensis]|nr:hypothetical protein [Nocardia neocaledoniensis]
MMAAVPVLVAVLGTGLGASGTVAVAAPAPVTDDYAAIQEFKTSNEAGWFYTLSQPEADSAVHQHGFTATEPIGSMHTKAGPGTVAVHRLRLAVGGPSYMLSVSANEIGNPKFVDEGVVGHVDSVPQPGQTRLLRFSKDNKWRVLSDHPVNIAGMFQAGYSLDGPIGWYRS